MVFHGKDYKHKLQIWGKEFLKCNSDKIYNIRIWKNDDWWESQKNILGKHLINFSLNKHNVSMVGQLCYLVVYKGLHKNLYADV